MNNKERKEILFKIYSENFKFIKENSSLKDKFDKDFGCFCPICLDYFEKADLFDKINPLTIEHNPPQSLGGKSSVLTCKKCNSEAGHKIDDEILTALKEIDTLNFKPNSEIKTQFFNDSTEGKGVNAKIKIQDDGQFIINIDTKNNNPKIHKKFFDSEVREYKSPLFSNDIREIGWKKKLTFNFKKPNKTNERLASISLLKIAHLMAFEKLGHLYLFNKNNQIIRDQIRSPEKEIITNPFWIKYNFPDNIVGVNIITKPRKLRSILVVFDLKTKSDSYRFSICLPGLSVGDENIYQNINDLLCQGNGFENAEVNNYINSEYNIKDVEKTFDLVRFWESFVEKQ
ncbi:HNH endonuclease [Mariniflexile litorale]|uniref:HNH endonuclease n=1 Tax=Mariniflexile litorale TaxID=3045158 RepID=A0AAU7EDF8_9FLAO|nr:HNH endonuclease [Mariniflexile sp. KMM 9835]MDQ8213602.1 HNH endonuclease [Mariniflexile sp. KMM 9835]